MCKQIVRGFTNEFDVSKQTGKVNIDVTDYTENGQLDYLRNAHPRPEGRRTLRVSLWGEQGGAAATLLDWQGDWRPQPTGPPRPPLIVKLTQVQSRLGSSGLLEAKIHQERSLHKPIHITRLQDTDAAYQYLIK